MSLYPTGAIVSEKNATVAPTNTSAALIAASTAGNRWTLLRNIGSVTVYVGFGIAATTGMFPVNPGETLRTHFLGAINGITASGTGSVAVLAEAR